MKNSAAPTFRASYTLILSYTLATSTKLQSRSQYYAETRLPTISRTALLIPMQAALDTDFVPAREVVPLAVVFAVVVVAAFVVAFVVVEGPFVVVVVGAAVVVVGCAVVPSRVTVTACAKFASAELPPPLAQTA